MQQLEQRVGGLSWVVYFGIMSHFYWPREMIFEELVSQMFVGEYHYPGEFWRLYRKLYHYKKEHFLPQERWVDRMFAVFGVDYAEFSRRY